MSGIRGGVERFLATWTLVALAAIAAPTPAGALPPEPDERVSPAAIFSLEWARRRQQRDTTPGAPFRADVPWPALVEGDTLRWWANLSAGGEWDTQPVLFTNSVGEPDEIHHGSHEAAGAWFADGGGEIFRRGDLAAGLGGSYWGSAHSNLDYDTNYPTVAAWFDWKFSEHWSLRLRYDVGYAWVDSDGFALTHFVGPSFFANWGEWGHTRLGGEYYNYSFDQIPPDYPTGAEPDPGGQCVLPPDPPSPFPCAPWRRSEGERRDRSGWGFLIITEHRMELDWNHTQLRGGYHYQHYMPGAEQHNQSHQVWLGATTDLPYGFLLDANVTYFYQGFRNHSSVPDPADFEPNVVWTPRGYRREDHVWRLYTAIGRPITSFMSASVEYAFENRDSNLSPQYDYDRHRVGGYLTVHFGRGGA